jgi:hypothetical protein
MNQWFKPETENVTRVSSRDMRSDRRNITYIRIQVDKVLELKGTNFIVQCWPRDYVIHCITSGPTISHGLYRSNGNYQYKEFPPGANMDRQKTNISNLKTIYPVMDNIYTQLSMMGWNDGRLVHIILPPT